MIYRQNLSNGRDAWKIAKDRFTDGLTPDQKKEFQDVKIEEIFYAASAAQKQASTSKIWRFPKKMMPLVNAMNMYAQSFDVISNSLSSILCPVWGSLRIVLKVYIYPDLSTKASHFIISSLSLCAMLILVYMQL